jgi:ATP adenylyltransferase
MLIVLNRHVAALSDCNADELAEMSSLMWMTETALRRAMNPDGINFGYNGGISAGAGIPEHLHLHLLPRWSGDTSFMSSIGDTRIMPQTLAEAYDQLAPVIAALATERT